MKLSTLFEILLILIIISFAAETKPVNGKGIFNYGVIKATIIMNVSYYIKYW